MATLSPEGNYNFRTDSLSPDTSQPELSPEEIIEAQTFEVIDNERNALMAIFAKNLSDVQGATTNPTILVEQTNRMLENADTAISGSIDTKKQLRRAGVALATKVSKRNIAVDTDDLELSQVERHDLIMEALLANRTARESQLEKEIATLKSNAELEKGKLEAYRLSLAADNPEALTAFDEQFKLFELSTTDAELTLTGELEAIAYSEEPILAPVVEQVETVRTPTGARAIIALASKALQRVMYRPNMKTPS